MKREELEEIRRVAAKWNGGLNLTRAEMLTLTNGAIDLVNEALAPPRIRDWGGELEFGPGEIIMVRGHERPLPCVVFGRTGRWEVIEEGGEIRIEKIPDGMKSWQDAPEYHHRSCPTRKRGAGCTC